VHPERNCIFLDQRHKLQTFIDLGCLLQITASSLSGKLGKDVQKMAEELLAENSVSAIASDCHNLKGRMPDLCPVWHNCSLFDKDSMTVSTSNLSFHKEY
jgi:protein-tyrosine phosphatase